jgi:hypothetical protein
MFLKQLPRARKESKMRTLTASLFHILEAFPEKRPAGKKAENARGKSCPVLLIHYILFLFFETRQLPRQPNAFDDECFSASAQH